MSTGRRRTFVPLVSCGTLLAALLVSGCTGGSTGSTSATGSTASKDDLVLGLEADIPGWDPGKILPGSVGWAPQAVYDTVFNCDELGNISPNIAQSYEFTDNNTKLTLHIRSGMKFSDGTPVDGPAVKSALEYQVNAPGGKSTLPGVTVSSPDASTVVMTTPTPKPYLTTYMCMGSGAVASPKYLASGNLDQAPVGSGPYVYDQAHSTPGSVYVFTKNHDNWDAGRYPYEKVTLKVLTDRTARLNALKTGQIAGAITDASTLGQLKSSGLNTLEQHGQWAGLLIEDRAGKIVPALGDVRVRQAINMVFDKAAIAQKLYQGQAEPTAQIFRKNSAAWIPDLKDPYPYDLAAAKKLMADAGYADGFSLEIPYLAGFGLDSAMPVAVQGLKELNIEAKQVTLSGANALLDMLSGKYPVIFWPLGNHGDSRLTIDGSVLPTSVWNTGKTSDPTVDQLWNTVLTSQGEASAAAQKALNKHIVDQAWFAPWVYMNSFVGYDPKKVVLQKSSDLNQLAPQLSDFR
ncbi:ABC transporter substrate-binding protein [Kitasatospora sp. YST-16]|uniref:ABC transporter substrate-binding protein n=1 Tax=Kitasatospora sp. YST-16 TaxID=2998080 RepID=UPI002283FC8F|nr:ABC transporter substrate-binding protein [Kitasatospora sp. YST-16]WAL74668.1 ABC transporter substrate-binding protein [Kitasatospora sp. YST-16]WNW40723.1 ABC transporter substrate-binding protein [Streptomyces sp. Li-HN-5-13]